ncbi:MAG TPA: hypothetical protein VFL77_04275 [Solirubrobacterales bacterium]|nr:hypothetical protein [Solirubrobacterales bacterium]
MIAVIADTHMPKGGRALPAGSPPRAPALDGPARTRPSGLRFEHLRLG